MKDALMLHECIFFLAQSETIRFRTWNFVQGVAAAQDFRAFSAAMSVLICAGGLPCFHSRRFELS